MAQWVKDLALLPAAAQVTAAAQVRSLAWELPSVAGVANKQTKSFHSFNLYLTRVGRDSYCHSSPKLHLNYLLLWD